MRHPLAGCIKPGTIFNDIFASLDWVPTFVEIAGGPKGNALNEQIMAGKYKGIVKTKLDGVNQIDYLTGKSAKSATRRLLLLLGFASPRQCGTRTGRSTSRWSADDPAGFIAGPLPYAWAQVVNIKRDPFETSIGQQNKTLLGMGGALAAPSTAYIYDWNLLPMGQVLWLKELETYKEFPPMQDPASYNLNRS